MRILLLLIFAGSLSISAVNAQTATTGTGGTITSAPSLGWNERIQGFRNVFLQSKNSRKPCVYPELVGRVDGLFRRYPMTHIVIHGFSDDRQPNTTDLYISEKEVCVSQSDDGWNLYADATHVFEWEQGGASSFLMDDLINVPGLVKTLQTHPDSLSQYLWEHLSAQTRQILTDQSSTKQQQQHRGEYRNTYRPADERHQGRPPGSAISSS